MVVLLSPTLLRNAKILLKMYIESLNFLCWLNYVFLWPQNGGNDQVKNLEWRRICEEQDLAYEQMLEADRQRDLERSNEAKKKKVYNGTFVIQTFKHICGTFGGDFNLAVW